MRVHFVHRHVLETVVILEEGNSPHPRCDRCNIQVPRRALNGRHPGTAQCLKGEKRKKRRLAEAETRDNSEWAFEAYGAPIESVTEFKYLGQSYRERLRDQVACRECGEMLAVGSLSSHLMNQHGRSAGSRRQWTTPAAGRGP